VRASELPIDASPPAWLLEAPESSALVATIRHHPGFPVAIRAIAGGMLDLCAADRALAGILKDAGRYVAAMCAASMQDEGVTLPRLKVLCESFGLLSAGRARALLIYLRYLGYVGLWGERAGNGPARYIPSAAFLDGWRIHLKVALEAVAAIDAFALDVARRLDDPVFFALFCRQQMEGLRAAVAIYSSDNALFRIFFHRHAGPHVAYSIMVQGHGECPPRGPLHISIAEIARRLDVSTVHLRRLVRDAEQEGLLIRNANSRYALTDSAVEGFAENYAIQFARLLGAAAATAKMADA
jgi:hypothetical protein